MTIINNIVVLNSTVCNNDVKTKMCCTEKFQILFYDIFTFKAIISISVNFECFPAFYAYFEERRNVDETKCYAMGDEYCCFEIEKVNE
ncbi:MAG: hypothetical protein ACXVHR_07050 [Methanobacterium sp.]